MVRTDNTRLTNKLLSRYSHDQKDEDNISNTILARLLFSLVITEPDRRQASYNELLPNLMIYATGGRRRLCVVIHSFLSSLGCVRFGHIFMLSIGP